MDIVKQAGQQPEKIKIFVSSYHGEADENTFHLLKPFTRQELMTDITIFPVESSFIKLAGYSPANKVLELHFGQNRTAFRYRGVPHKVWLDLIGAKSIGSFFHKKIKGQYKHVEMACRIYPLFLPMESEQHQKR